MKLIKLSCFFHFLTATFRVTFGHFWSLLVTFGHFWSLLITYEIRSISLGSWLLNKKKPKSSLTYRRCKQRTQHDCQVLLALVSNEILKFIYVYEAFNSQASVIVKKVI
jgi:hypothetical protein